MWLIIPILWYCIDDWAAVFFNKPELGGVPIVVIVIIGLFFDFAFARLRNS